MALEKDKLWQRVIATTEHALETGALLSIPTNAAFVEEKGVRFFVRVLESLKRKDEARKEQAAASNSGKRTNPFLPPERDLTVGGITETHIAVLNKFNVMKHHLLIVTRHFEDQETLLTLEDFEALRLCMAGYDSLGFYNGGREAGASQQHKHLQLVPLPLAPDGPGVPVEPLLRQAAPSCAVSRVPGFPFLHAFVRLDQCFADAPADSARETHRLYCAMLESVGMQPPVQSRLTLQTMPYCLLVAREWMLLVPRSREFVEDVSLNSLAYAGSFFVRDEEQLRRLRTCGFMNALRSAARES